MLKFSFSFLPETLPDYGIRRKSGLVVLLILAKSSVTITIVTIRKGLPLTSPTIIRSFAIISHAPSLYQ